MRQQEIVILSRADRKKLYEHFPAMNAMAISRSLHFQRHSNLCSKVRCWAMNHLSTARYVEY